MEVGNGLRFAVIHGWQYAQQERAQTDQELLLKQENFLVDELHELLLDGGFGLMSEVVQIAYEEAHIGAEDGLRIVDAALVHGFITSELGLLVDVLLREIDLALEDHFVDLEDLHVDLVKLGCEALRQALSQLLLHWREGVFVRIESFFELLKQVAEIDPLGGRRELLQDA